VRENEKNADRPKNRKKEYKDLRRPGTKEEEGWEGVEEPMVTCRIHICYITASFALTPPGYICNVAAKIRRNKPAWKRIVMKEKTCDHQEEITDGMVQEILRA